MRHKFEKFCKSPENIENYEKAKADSFKGRHWYNNGEINIMAKECPPGFMPGMLNK